MAQPSPAQPPVRRPSNLRTFEPSRLAQLSPAHSRSEVCTKCLQTACNFAQTVTSCLQFAQSVNKLFAILRKLIQSQSLSLLPAPILKLKCVEKPCTSIRPEKRSIAQPAGVALKCTTRMKLKPGGGLHYNASTAGVVFLARAKRGF